MNTTDYRNGNNISGFGFTPISDRNPIVRFVLRMIHKIKPEKNQSKELYRWTKYSFMQ
ncbi:hypothetical protein ABN763_16690 [Spongiivirga sp. MCCC 1A20706]|uniref:hypothetical protein n=1 Tax=Spongiivirga sp. MCCC 1A20706 TaxID=3160963 RepID=UPI003977B556